MTEQTFPMPQVWSVGRIEDEESVGKSVTIKFHGAWDEKLKNDVALAMRWAATRIAVARIDEHYLRYWLSQNPMPASLQANTQKEGM